MRRTACETGVRLQVIVADDNCAVRSAIVRLITRLGCEVLATASSGHELQTLLAASSNVDLVISDNDMPDGKGIQVLDHPEINVVYAICSGQPPLQEWTPNFPDRYAAG